MRILFSSSPMFGHILPLVPLARAARAAGHEVALVTNAGMKDAVDGDLPVLGAGPTVDAAIAEMTSGREIMAKSGNSDQAIQLFVGYAQMAIAEALDQARRWKPDFIVSERSDLTGPMVAAHLNVPWSVLALGPALEDELLERVAAAVAPVYRQRGVAPSSPFAYIDICPPALQAPAWRPPANRISMRPEAYRQEGFDWSAPSFSGREDRPLVLVTLGTVYNKPDVLTAILASLEPLDVNVVATLGSTAAPDNLEVDTTRVRTVGFAPLELLLDGVSAVVSVGGAGTTLASLSRGIPLVLFPQGADHPRNASRASAAGAATVVDGVDGIGPALSRVIQGDSFRRQAGAVAEEISEMNAPADTLEVLLRQAPGA